MKHRQAPPIPPLWTRRTFLRVAGASAACAWTRVAAAPSGPDVATVSIFHTTDLHGNILPTSTYEGVGNRGGLARCAAVLRKWRAENPSHIVLDIGDVYQGTDVGLRTGGEVMIRCLNALRYDAWVVGNHELDWGQPPFRAAVAASQMPVLCANARVAHAPTAAKIAPSITREFDGIRIAILGVTTPGMPFWLPGDCIEGFEVSDPLEALRTAAPAARKAGAHAVLVAGHMGVRPRGDDFANRVESICKARLGIDAFIAGHTHKDIPSQDISGTLYTQADYFGIHIGRLDLAFDRPTRKLIGATAWTLLMDGTVTPDPEILALAKADLDASAAALARPAGTLDAPLRARPDAPGEPSGVERLLAAAIREALERDGHHVDAVLHGVFGRDLQLPAGPLSVADVWKILPFENTLVTATLDRDQLAAVAREAVGGQGPEGARALVGPDLRPTFETAPGGRPTCTGIAAPDGKPFPPGKRFRVALNSYDAQSGGQRLNATRDLLAKPAAAAMAHPIPTRAALLDYLANHNPYRP